MKRIAGLWLLAAVVLWTARPAAAQMFGDRELGGFLSRRNSPGAMSNPAESMVNGVGTLTGNERFVRGNRRATDFIGLDMGDNRDFVGVTQARQRRMPLAAESVREVPLPNVNQQGDNANGANSIYLPRLELSSGLAGPAATAVESSLLEHLQESPIQWLRPLEVEMIGRTAVLRGEVASDRDRALATALVQFEPGVSDVQNDLQVARPDSPAPRAQPAAPSIESLPGPSRSPREF